MMFPTASVIDDSQTGTFKLIFQPRTRHHALPCTRSLHVMSCHLEQGEEKIAPFDPRPPRTEAYSSHRDLMQVGLQNDRCIIRGAAADKRRPCLILR